MRNVKILSHRDTPSGFDATTLGLLSFSYDHDAAADGPLLVTRWQKGKEGKEGRSWPCARVMVTGTVTVLEASLRTGSNGKPPWVQISNMDVPQDVRDEVAKGAARLFAPAAPADSFEPPAATPTRGGTLTPPRGSAA